MDEVVSNLVTAMYKALDGQQESNQLYSQRIYKLENWLEVTKCNNEDDPFSLVL